MTDRLKDLVLQCSYESICEQYKEIDRLRREIERLKQIIKSEGEKWEAHHSDPIKKMYWREFAGKADLILNFNFK